MDTVERARSAARKVLGFGLLAGWALIALSVVADPADGRIALWRALLGAVTAAGFTWMAWQVVDELLDRRRYPAWRVVAAAVLVVATALAGGTDPLGWGVLLLCLLGAAALLRRLAVEAHRAGEAGTRLALAEERLRSSREVHDLVGHQLSAIAVKTELAVRLSDKDTEAARAEMAEVNALTRKALKEVRQAVRGLRELDLAAELNSVKSVLEAAGVRCEVGLPHREMPDGVAPVFAFAVREAVTNVLKHSTATFCDISFRFTADEAELTVRNDGVARRKAADLGSGLAGLSERLAAVGGSMTAQPTEDGHFLLRAVVSLPMAG
ncbi:histidine kinase [Nonomuraea sp. N2-4H]|jgi:two-component system sensor histidine kinase DesK|uniref:sensor histidine kinase n=1 Tax=Nonomuraea sp. N2-4H TaxID=3128898 RepID=UPI0032474E5E